MPLVTSRLRVETRQPSWTWFPAVLVYALFLIPLLYGLKCIVTLHGELPVGNRTTLHSFYVAPVHGAAALVTGLGYIALGLFAVLSTGDPPPENRHWLWRILRAIARWGGLVSFFWLWQRARQLIHADGPWPTLQSGDYLFAFRVATMCFGVIALLCFLWAMFQREAVKRDLFENRCIPVHIWWRPAAYWLPFLAGSVAFRVIYRDRAGFLHKAYCFAYQPLWESPIWGSRRVRWLRDQITENPPEAWVVVDSLPVRSQLDAYTPSAETKNLLLDNLDQGRDA
jgi:hypothetical protein